MGPGKAGIKTLVKESLANLITSDIVIHMKTLSVTEVARNFSAVMDRIEMDQEEVVLVRNQKPIARLVPEPPALDALAVMGDMFRTLDDATADALTAAVARGRKTRQGTLNELRNPWAS